MATAEIGLLAERITRQQQAGDYFGPGGVLALAGRWYQLAHNKAAMWPLMARWHYEAFGFVDMEIIKKPKFSDRLRSRFISFKSLFLARYYLHAWLLDTPLSEIPDEEVLIVGRIFLRSGSCRRARKIFKILLGREISPVIRAQTLVWLALAEAILGLTKDARGHLEGLNDIGQLDNIDRIEIMRIQIETLFCLSEPGLAGVKIAEVNRLISLAGLDGHPERMSCLIKKEKMRRDLEQSKTPI